MMSHFTKGIRQALGLVFTLGVLFSIAYAADIFTVDNAGTKKFVVTDEGKITIGATESYVNLVIQNDGVAPNNKVGMTADVITVEGIRIENLNVSADITVTGAGGLDTGAEAGNTWYYLWVLTNNDGSSINGLISASSTAPTVPGGFTKKRRIGSLRNNATNNFYPLRQFGNYVSYHNGAYSYGVLSAGTATTYTAVSCQEYVPPTSREAELSYLLSVRTATIQSQWAKVRETGTSHDGQIWLQTVVNVANQKSEAMIKSTTLLDASQNLDYTTKGGVSFGGFYINVSGYYDRI